jgi:hypothetical protein
MLHSIRPRRWNICDVSRNRWGRVSLVIGMMNRLRYRRVSVMVSVIVKVRGSSGIMRARKVRMWWRKRIIYWLR